MAYEMSSNSIRIFTADTSLHRVTRIFWAFSVRVEYLTDRVFLAASTELLQWVRTQTRVRGRQGRYSSPKDDWRPSRDAGFVFVNILHASTAYHQPILVKGAKGNNSLQANVHSAVPQCIVRNFKASTPICIYSSALMATPQSTTNYSSLPPLIPSTIRAGHNTRTTYNFFYFVPSLWNIWKQYYRNVISVVFCSLLVQSTSGLTWGRV